MNKVYNLKDDYKRWSVVYLTGAETLYKIENRRIGSWIPAYYLLTHSLELILKAKILAKIANNHDVQKLAKMFDSSETKLTDDEKKQILELSKLNIGPGGLRYDNKTEGVFSPKIFVIISDLIKKLLKDKT